jgi:Domain of unknown function (DUF4394)
MRKISALTTAGLILATAAASQAQIVGYGVDSDGFLFRFDPAAPGPIPVTSIGNTGVAFSAIDFRPGTQELYGLAITSTEAQLYTIDINTGVATPRSLSIPLSGTNYTLTANERVGLDFNPTTLQADNSMRIRVVTSSRNNLRLNSATGGLASGDPALNFASSTDAPFVDAAAYINNFPNAATSTTALFVMDARNDELYLQNPPNNGVLNLVGPFGVSVDANPGIAFDIVSTNPSDTTLADEQAFAVLQRQATASGAYLLYNVNLSTGTISNGKLFANGADFVGGMALTVIPEPALLGVIAGAATLLLRRRRS